METNNTINYRKRKGCRIRMELFSSFSSIFDKDQDMDYYYVSGELFLNGAAQHHQDYIILFCSSKVQTGGITICGDLSPDSITWHQICFNGPT